VKKNHQFLSSTEKDAHKRKLVAFQCVIAVQMTDEDGACCMYLSPEQTADANEHTPHPLVSSEASRVEEHPAKLRYHNLHTTHTHHTSHQ